MGLAKHLLLPLGPIGWAGWSYLAWREHKQKQQEREQKLLDAFSFKPENIHGKSAFAGASELELGACFREGGVYVGDALDTNQRVYFHGKIRPHAGLIGGSWSCPQK